MAHGSRKAISPCSISPSSCSSCPPVTCSSRCSNTRAIADSELKASKPYLLANSIAGLTVTGLGICVAFIPSRQVNSIWIYELKLILGCAIVFGTAYFFYRRSLRNAHQAVLLEVTAADAS